MSVRAKFTVSSKEERMSYNGTKETVVKLRPVTSGSKENEEFYKYTPSGNVDLGTINQEAADFFEFGKEYYLDFTEAK